MTTAGIVLLGGLSADLKAFGHPRKAEVLHDQWAILGTLECHTPELLPKTTVIDYGASRGERGEWFKAGTRQVHTCSVGVPGCPDGCHRRAGECNADCFVDCHA